MSTTLGVTRPEQASYMLRAAASNAGRAYKHQLIDLLDVAPGQTAAEFLHHLSEAQRVALVQAAASEHR